MKETQQTQATQATLATLATVIVPAYNEEEGLPIVLEKLLKVIDGTYEVIVVDDGSPDKTGEKASSFPCKSIRHERNRGKGRGLSPPEREN